MAINKVFGIGLSRTGTTSLSQALTKLGYESAHFVNAYDFEKYNAICDTPVPILYKTLDKEYPNSKFILTVRSIDSWIKSFEKHRSLYPWVYKKGEVAVTSLQLYGTVHFEPEKVIKGYSNHYNEVISYFSDRPNDLLIMNICEGDGWEKLCPFLDKDIPNIPFPKSNTKEDMAQDALNKKKQKEKEKIHKKNLVNKLKNKLRLITK